jgi:hypothetical protein
MKSGDHLQYPNVGQFTVPEYYNKHDERYRKNLFWEKMMKPHQPFKFAEVKRLPSNPICWTNESAILSDIMDIHV